MVAGGVGPRAVRDARGGARRAAASAPTLFYGARTRARSSSAWICSSASASSVVLATEDGSCGERGRVTAPLGARTGSLGARPVAR